jgi:hypothetical protein
MVQHAFPNVPVGVRERLISGLCSKCWDKTFAGPVGHEEEIRRIKKEG